MPPDLVLEQLERLVSSPPFRNSKRYPALLRHVVERALDGRASELKERNVAVDVFGRPPSYEPSADPIVRTAAGEVRKRLAQYYQEPEHERELHIDLPVGSYVPEFQWPAAPAPAADVPVAQKRRTWLALGIALTIAVLGVVVVTAIRGRNAPSALDAFWNPLVGAQGSVMICMGPVQPQDPAKTVLQPVAWADAVTLARITAQVRMHGKSVQFCRADHASFNDFERASAVLVGAFNDGWTLRLMQDLRFTFQNRDGVLWIADQRDPSNKKWSINLQDLQRTGGTSLTHDYAIISRVSDHRTGGMIITVAGLLGTGTEAAGKFLVDDHYMQSIEVGAPPDWRTKNVELVIGTEIVGGSPGPPALLASVFW